MGRPMPDSPGFTAARPPQVDARRRLGGGFFFVIVHISVFGGLRPAIDPPGRGNVSGFLSAACWPGRNARAEEVPVVDASAKPPEWSAAPALGSPPADGENAVITCCWWAEGREAQAGPGGLRASATPAPPTPAKRRQRPTGQMAPAGNGAPWEFQRQGLIGARLQHRPLLPAFKQIAAWVTPWWGAKTRPTPKKGPQPRPAASIERMALAFDGSESAAPTGEWARLSRRKEAPPRPLRQELPRLPQQASVDSSNNGSPSAGIASATWGIPSRWDSPRQWGLRRRWDHRW